MSDLSIYNVGVVGGGVMGGGISALMARNRIPVTVKEESEALVQKTRDAIYGRFQNWLDKSKISPDELEELKRLVTVTTRTEDLATAQLVVEAVTENLELKKSIFVQLDRVLSPEAIIASNTSSLPITELAAATGRRDRVAGMHFFNPPTTMALVELVRGKDTSDETLSTLENFAASTLKKMTIRVTDRPGFLVNRLLMPWLVEPAITLATHGISPEAVDAEALAHRWPLGPFSLLDVVGIDVAHFVGGFLSKTNPDRFPMPSLFDRLVTVGRFGQKSGAGFYSYADTDAKSLETLLQTWYPNRAPAIPAPEIFERMMAGMLNEAVGALEEEVASRGDIELGAQAGIGFPGKGPLHAIDALGHGKLLETLEHLERTQGKRFAPYALLRQTAQEGTTFFKGR